MNSEFHCTSIEDYGNQRLAIVRGLSLAGEILPGMLLHVALNTTFEMTVPIREVLDSGHLLVDCDDQEGVDTLLAFDIENELLAVAY